MSKRTEAKTLQHLARMDDTTGTQLSASTFNLALGGLVLYGLLMNVLFCSLFGDVTQKINPIVFLLGYLVSCIAGIVICRKAQSPLVCFLGYNLIVLPVGMVVGAAIESYGGLSSAIVLQAFVYTAGITVIMIAASVAFPQFFSKIGGFLLIALIGLLLIQVIGFLFHIQIPAISYGGAAIFSLYIGYDYWRAQQYPKTFSNAVYCAVDLYLDLVNLFLYILRILGKSDK